MRSNNDLEVSGYDFIAAGLYLVLVAVGWSMIFASEYQPETYKGLFDFQKNYGKQLLFILVSFGLLGILQLIEGKFYETFSIVFYGAVLVLLLGVLFTKPINGAKAWFELGIFRLQPSEFGKTATALFLATFLARTDVRLDNNKYLSQALAIIFIPILLISRQPDMGSVIVYASFMFVLFRAGLTVWLYVWGIILISLSISALLFDSVWAFILFLIMIGNALFLWNWRKDWLIQLGFWAVAAVCLWFYSAQTATIFILLQLLVLVGLAIWSARSNWQWSAFTVSGILVASLYVSSVNYIFNNFLEPHQQERIWVWLRPEKCDPLGSLYNLEQSKFAIGSGGIAGKGFLQGERTKLDYVPEQSTDFIFCTVGEEWGFLGSSILILLFLGFMVRIVQIAERQRSIFTKFYAYGVAGIFFVHFFINIGMTMGLMPVIGIPLPFISYGGSSLFSFTIMVGILLKLDSSRLF